MCRKWSDQEVYWYGGEVDVFEGGEGGGGAVSKGRKVGEVFRGCRGSVNTWAVEMGIYVRGCMREGVCEAMYVRGCV